MSINQKLLCIYHHPCADGFSAAWAVRQALGEDNVDFYPGAYGEAPPDVEGREVLIVDFSYKRGVLIEMGAKARSIVILDHHKSAAEDLKDFIVPGCKFATRDNIWDKAWLHPTIITNIAAVFDMDRSGAVITYQFLVGFHAVIPRLLLHVQDRDLWKFELDGTAEIMARVFLEPFTFEAWDELANTTLDKLRAEGAVLVKKHSRDAQSIIDKGAYRMQICGFDVPAVNAPHIFASEIGHILAQNEPFAAVWIEDDGSRAYSLRSAEKGGIDVSEIAKRFGGGGHFHAAGFKLRLPTIQKLGGEPEDHAQV